ncbi:cTAGE family member 9-like [Callospermophilus lateralis]
MEVEKKWRRWTGKGSEAREEESGRKRRISFCESYVMKMKGIEIQWVVLEEAPRVVAAFSEDMKPGHLPYGFPWELVMCTALGFFAVLSLFWRGFQSVRSRLYVGREKRLALNLAGLIEAKCGLLEKVSLVEKEHEGLESSLKDCRFEKGSREAQQLEATDEKLHRSESSHGVEMLFLEEELKAQKSQHGQQDETMAHLSRRIQSLQCESESLRSQIAEEDLTEQLKSLQTEQASLQSENAQLQSENETPQKNFKVMMERYQENMMKLHRKLRVEENYRVEQKEKLSKVEEKMSHTIKELETYRKRAQYLEEQLQSTIRSCLGKIISSEKEADASELATRIAERNLRYFRKQNARNRQKLTEKELRFELVEKDPYDALDETCLGTW